LFVCVQHKFQPEWFLFEREREKDFNPNHLVLCVWYKFQPKSFLFPYHTIKKNNINSMCLMKPWGNKVFYWFFLPFMLRFEFGLSTKQAAIWTCLSIRLPRCNHSQLEMVPLTDHNSKSLLVLFLTFGLSILFLSTSNSCLVKSRTFLMTFEIWQMSERTI
jgi:hypothetical protein